MVLLSVLNRWNDDFRMKISESKSEILSTSEIFGWPSFVEENGLATTLETAEYYDYLGVRLNVDLKSSQKLFNKKLSAKARSWTNSIIKLRRTEPDKVEVALALWKSYAISSMLYCAEVMPPNNSALDIIETQQSILGKAILQVPQSSAKEIVMTDLGLKPIRLSLEERRLSYYLKIKSPTYKGSNLIKECIKIQEQAPRNHSFISEINKIKRKLGGEIKNTWRVDLHNYYKTEISNTILMKHSLV